MNNYKLMNTYKLSSDIYHAKLFVQEICNEVKDYDETLKEQAYLIHRQLGDFCILYGAKKQEQRQMLEEARREIAKRENKNE